MFHQQLKNLWASPRFEALKELALHTNEWFTAASIDTAVAAIVEALPPEEPTIVKNNKTVGVVCAGNIPFVGFWDMYSAVVSGAKVVIKPSRRDPLMGLFEGLVEVTSTLPPTLDTILAMGSDATMSALGALHPKSRLIAGGSEVSFALLSGTETPDELEQLGDDLFTHAGMGCRSVVHLFLPVGYALDRLQFSDRSTTLPSAWADNVRYERARRTLANEQMEDRGFFLLVPNRFGSPVRPGVVGYSYYQDQASLEIDWSKVKCYTSLIPLNAPEKHTPFGSTQHPIFAQVFQRL